MPNDESPWTTAFKELYKSTKDQNITGKEKSNLFRQLGQLKKNMGASSIGDKTNPNIIPIPTPLGETTTNLTNKEISNAINFGLPDTEDKKKGGLIRGHGKIMPHKIKYTKKY
jgi:hypothetical protein